jgi:hypothetical protein
MSIPDVSLAVGDRQPPFVRTWVDENGNSVNLTGYTVVCRFQDQGRANAAISGAVVVTNDPAGIPAVCTYNWGVSDTAVPALYDAEFVATKTGAQMTFPGDRMFLFEFRPHV